MVIHLLTFGAIWFFFGCLAQDTANRQKRGVPARWLWSFLLGPVQLIFLMIADPTKHEDTSTGQAPARAQNQLAGNGWTSLAHLMKLYDNYSDAIHRYNSIIWQFPAAFLTVNVLGIRYLHGGSEVALSVVNFFLIHAFFKHVANQQVIFDALRSIEGHLKERLEPRFMADFPARTNKVLSARSAVWVGRCLLYASFAQLVVSAATIFDPRNDNGTQTHFKNSAAHLRDHAEEFELATDGLRQWAADRDSLVSHLRAEITVLEGRLSYLERADKSATSTSRSHAPVK